MNERIKQLAEQAGIAVWGDAVYMYHPGNTLDSTVMTKFAELIVRECRDIVSANRDLAIEDGWNVDEAMSTAMFDIEDHFGVENEAREIR